MAVLQGFNLLGRYPISVILSYLQEEEGVALLVTKRRLAQTILPLFRQHEGKLKGLVMAAPKRRRNRHTFLVYPVEDPRVLLARLNTIRLHHRCRITSSSSSLPTLRCFARNKTTHQLAQQTNEQFQSDPPLLRFLSPKEGNDELTLLVSYPRSGNTLLRTLLERVTGVVTGSDTRPDRKLSMDLQKLGFVGEGVINRVHVCKTHFPERSGVQPFQAKKAILLVRNPYDAIDSYWNLNLTNTHTETVTDEIYERYSDTFNDFAKNEFQVWMKFHRFWLNAPIQLLVIRFEDLLVNTAQELKRIVNFSLAKTKDDEQQQQRIDQMFQNHDHKLLGSYQPRVCGNVIYGKSLAKGRYTNEAIQEFHDIACKFGFFGDSNLLQQFGYDMQVQSFPHTLSSLQQHDLERRTSTDGCICVNDGTELRAIDDPFGRHMKQWRMSRTKNDTEPFKTVRRSQV